MRRNINGFTVVELLVVIMVIGILATITVFTFSGVQKSSRDSTRQARAKLIATSLESYYLRRGEYPNCTALTQSSSSVIANTLVDLKADDLTAPLAANGTNSIVCGDLDPSGTDSFGYVGDTSAACTAANGSCAQFTLEYRDETSGTVKSINSKHHLDTALLTKPSASVNILSSTSVSVSWSTVKLAETYTLDWSTSNTFTSYSTASNIKTTSYTLTGLSQGVTYYFRVKALATGLDTTQSSAVGATTTIDAPSSPSVGAGMSNGNAVGTSGSVTCPSGTTAYYALRYNVNDGGWSNWSSFTSPAQSYVVGTNQGYKYTFNAAARCQTASAVSNTSAGNTAYTVRPIDQPPAPGWNTGGYYQSGEQFYVNYVSYCPAGTWAVNTWFQSYPWPGADPRIYYYNPWGYLDSWDGISWSDQTVEYWGYYQCATNYTTSPTSVWSYNTLTIHRDA